MDLALTSWLPNLSHPNHIVLMLLILGIFSAKSRGWSDEFQPLHASPETLGEHHLSGKEAGRIKRKKPRFSQAMLLPTLQKALGFLCLNILAL